MRVELEAFGKTTDQGVNRLLRSLSLYGYRQPKLKESRLTMRWKIRSLIIRYGIPAIWFTLNPNDITSPIKLKLVVYRTRKTSEAEGFLRSLDQAYQGLQGAPWDHGRRRALPAVVPELSVFRKHLPPPSGP